MFQTMLTSPLISFKFKFKLLWFYLTFFWTCFRLACGSEHICDLVTTGVRLKLQGILHWDDSLLIVVDGQVYDLDLANEQRQKELARDHTMMMYNLGANEKPQDPCVPDCPQQTCQPCDPTSEPPEPETPEPAPTETPEPEPEPTTASYDNSVAPNRNFEQSVRRSFASRRFGHENARGDCDEACTQAPCVSTCPPPENTPSFELIQPVPWTEHQKTRTEDDSFHSKSLNRISLFHIRKCDQCGQEETRYYVHYYFTDLRIYMVRQDHKEVWTDGEKEYRFFATVTNGKSKGYIFYYSDYIHFDQESITEDVDHIIAHRRVVVGPMIDCCRAQNFNATYSWLPFATPETTEHVKLKAGPNMLVMKVLDSTRQVFNLLPYSDTEEIANAEDLFRTVPFGFIHNDLAYLFTVANQEVVVIKAGDCEQGHATVHIIDKVPWRSFFKCSPGQTRSVMDQGAKKYSQSEYDALARSMRDGLPDVSGLSAGALIGLAGGSVLLILGLIATLLFFSKRKGSKGSRGSRTKKRTSKSKTTTNKTKTRKSSSAKTTTTATKSKASDSTSKKKTSTKKEPSGKQEASGPKKANKKKPSKKKPSKKKPSNKK